MFLGGQLQSIHLHRPVVVIRVLSPPDWREQPTSVYRRHDLTLPTRGQRMHSSGTVQSQNLSFVM